LSSAAEPKDTAVFRCRSGKRPDAAATATAAAGFGSVLNVVGGFEGDLDEQGQRGRLGGWRKAGLPWQQA
jgi:rhodanese-related sulfurtransferase